METIKRLAREILASDPSKISKSQWIKILENAQIFSKDNPNCDTDMFIKSTAEPIFNSIYVKRDGHCVVEILRKDPKDITLEELNFSESFLYYLESERLTVSGFIFFQNIQYLEFLIAEELRKLGAKFKFDAEFYSINSKKIIPTYTILWKDISFESPEAVSLAFNIQNVKTIEEIDALYTHYTEHYLELNEETKNAYRICKLGWLLTFVCEIQKSVYDSYLQSHKNMQAYSIFNEEYGDFFTHPFLREQYFKEDRMPSDNAIQLCKEQLQNSQCFYARYIKKKEYIDAIQRQLHEKITEAKRVQNSLTNANTGKEPGNFTYTPGSGYMTDLNKPFDHEEIENYLRDVLFNELDKIKKCTNFNSLIITICNYFSIQHIQKNEEVDIFIKIADPDYLNSDFLGKALTLYTNKTIDRAKEIFASYSTFEMFKKDEDQWSKEEKTFGKNYQALKKLIEDKQINIDAVYKRIKRMQIDKDWHGYKSFHDYYCNYLIVKNKLEKLQTETSPPIESLCNDFISHLTLQNTKSKSKTKVKDKQKSRSRPHSQKDGYSNKENDIVKPSIRQSQHTKKRSILVPLHQLLSSKQIIFDMRVANWFIKDTPCLLQDSYRELSPFEKKEQKLFHRYPLEVTKISLMKGTQSLWNNEDPHYSIVGQIERYKPGKEITYQGVFTDCFDRRNTNRLYHHYFIRRSFSKSLEDSFNKLIFQPTVDLQRARDAAVSEQTQNIPKKKMRPVIEQRPGIIIVDDKVKQVRYTVLISSYQK